MRDTNRKAALYDHQRSLMRQLNKLTTNYNLESQVIQDKLNRVNLSLWVTSLDGNWKLFYSKIQSLPTICGIYCIKVDGRVYYVGESINIRKRALQHLQQIQKHPTMPLDRKDKMSYVYSVLSQFNPSLFSIEVLQEMSDNAYDHKISPKRARIRLEAEYIQKFKSEGHPVQNPQNAL